MTSSWHWITDAAKYLMRFYHYVWYKVQQQQVQLTDISGIWSGDYEDRHSIKIFWDDYEYDINMNLIMLSAICVSASLWWLISILGIVPLGNKFCLCIWHQQCGPLLDGIMVRSQSVMIKLTVNRKKMISQYTNIQKFPPKGHVIWELLCYTPYPTEYAQSVTIFLFALLPHLK